MITFVHHLGTKTSYGVGEALERLLLALLEEGFSIADADRRCVMVSKGDRYWTFEGFPGPMQLLVSVAEFRSDAYADGRSVASVRARIVGWFRTLAPGRSVQELEAALTETMDRGDVLRCATLASLGVTDPAAISGALAAPPAFFRHAAVAALSSCDPAEQFRGFN